MDKNHTNSSRTCHFTINYQKVLQRNYNKIERERERESLQFEQFGDICIRIWNISPTKIIVVDLAAIIGLYFRWYGRID